MNNNTEIKNWEGKYRVLKREFKKIKPILSINRIIKYLFVTFTVILLIWCSKLYMQNKILLEENAQLYADNLECANQLNMYIDTSLYFADMAIAMDDTNANLKNVISMQEEELMAYKQREELYDSYEWALYDKSGKRTDITYGQIQSLSDYCLGKGYSNDMVDLVLAIAMKESTGHEKAQNASGATGYCQLLNSTARFVYTELEGHETYTHDDALDGEKNLKMCADYLDYLYRYHGRDNIKMIDSYRGAHIQSYINVINSYLKNNDLDIYNIEIEDIEIKG